MNTTYVLVFSWISLAVSLSTYSAEKPNHILIIPNFATLALNSRKHHEHNVSNKTDAILAIKTKWSENVKENSENSRDNYSRENEQARE